MWLKLNLDGIIISLRIQQYRKTNQSNCDDVWCKVDFSFCSEPWLNYHKEYEEVLLAREIDSLTEDLEKLLNDQLSEPTEFSCIEPDFVFNLNPKEDVRNNPRLVYVRPGYEIVDIDMEWRVNFWDDGCLTANYLSVSLCREEIEYLLIYLKIVSRQLSEHDDIVQELISKGILY